MTSASATARQIEPSRALNSWAFAVTFCLSLGAVAAAAAAQDDVSHPPHEAQGEALFAAGNYDAALNEFLAAYDDMPTTSGRYFLLWNIGQCYERLFQYDRALEYYQTYLDEGGDGAEDRAAVEATMRALEGLLGAIEVQTSVDGAEIWLDGHVAGHSPDTVRATSGTHRLEVRLQGYAAELREVELAVRQTIQVQMTLHVVSDFRGLDPWIFWTSTGLAGVALISGIAVGVAALLDHQATVALETGDLTQEDRDRIGGLALGADILYGVAAVFGITSVVLAFLTDWAGGAPSGSTDTRISVAPYGSSSSFGLAARGRF